MTDFEKALDTHLKGCQQIINDHFAKHLPNLNSDTLSISRGRKYVKIIRSDRSVFSFIDITTGSVLKPASWRAPAKHARGNIYNDDHGLSSMTPYGPAYLR